VPYADEMTREQAEQRAAELNRDRPDRYSARWIARERDGVFEVARISLPSGMKIDPVTETTEAKPKPPHPDDPRPAFERNVGGPYGPV
jgi:hypothetical protein